MAVRVLTIIGKPRQLWNAGKESPSGYIRTPFTRKAARFSLLRDAERRADRHMSSRKKTLILTAPEPKAGTKFVKVRLDGRTIVHLKSMKAFPFWKGRYPNAEVIE